MAVRLPILPTLSGYQRSSLGPDVLAGLTLVAIAVPEQMATAHLANMPEVAGLYAFVAGSLLFALIGCNRQMSVGADSTIAPIIAAGVLAVAAVGAPDYTHLVSFLALMVGVLVIAVGLLRLGWIAELISTPVITGVLGGIAIEILVRQLPAILGLAGGGTTTVERVQKVLDQIGHTNSWSILIAVVVLVLIVAAEHIDRRIPGALIGLVVSIVAVAALKLDAHGVQVVGTIHGGLPAFAVPSSSWVDARHLVVPALTIAFVCVAQTAATIRASTTAPAGAQDFNRDLVAIGAGSVVAGLSGSFAVDSSPPRTAIVTASGGRSQVTSIIAAGIALGVVLFATGLLKDLPKATLGAILVFVATRLFRIKVLRQILAFSRVEFGLAVVTLLTVAFFGIEQGVVLAIVLCLADRTRRAARPRDSILGREPGTDHWIPTDSGRPTEQATGIVVYLIYGPVWYGNADFVRLRIRHAITEAAQPVHGLVLDANGIPDIDFTGTQALGELGAELKTEGVTIAIARASHLVHRDLQFSGLLASLGPNRVYDTVDAAVLALTPAK